MLIVQMAPLCGQAFGKKCSSELTEFSEDWESKLEMLF